MEPEQLLASARDNPAEIAQSAQEALAAPQPPDAVAILHEALGWAKYELGELAAARSHAERGIAAAEEIKARPSLVGLGHLLGTACIELGAAADAERVIRELAESSSADEEVLMRSVLAIVLGETGRLDEAMGQFETAIALIDPQNAPLLVRVFNNRAVIWLDAGELGPALDDLDVVEELASQLDDRLMRSIVQHNRGVVAARMSQFPRALELFAESAVDFRQSNLVAVLGRSFLDIGQLWLDTGLLREGRLAATEAIAVYTEANIPIRLMESYELLARIEAADDQWAAASRSAQQAVEVCATADLGANLMHRAEGLRVALQLAASTQTDGGTLAATTAVSAIDALARYPETAVDAGVVLLRDGRTDEASACFDAALAAEDDSALGRLHRVLARAADAYLRGDTKAALAEVRAGLQHVIDNGFIFGVTDLRGAALRRTQQLRALGIRVLLGAEAPPADLIELLEMERAARIVPEPALTDAELALVGQLRRSVAAERRAVDVDAKRRLLDERRSVEDHLREMRRQHPTEQRDGDAGLAGTRVLVHQFRHDDSVMFLVEHHSAEDQSPEEQGLEGHGGESLLLAPIDAGSFEQAARATNLLLGLSATRPLGSEVDQALAHLRQVLAPLLDVLETESAVVVVVDASLPPVPWSLLTSAEVSEVPSAAVTGDGSGSARGSTVAVAGPGLRFASDEAHLVADVSGGSALVGSSASAENVASVLEHAGTLHVAAHGHFRSDNPLCSSLDLHDGPLSFFDLLATTSTPHHVVFSACDVGSTTGDSPITLASLLLQRGCRGIVASAGPVNDQASLQLMELVHKRLSTGASLAESLLDGQRQLQRESPSIALYRTFGAS